MRLSVREINLINPPTRPCARPPPERSHARAWFWTKWQMPWRCLACKRNGCTQRYQWFVGSCPIAPDPGKFKTLRSRPRLEMKTGDETRDAVRFEADFGRLAPRRTQRIAYRLFGLAPRQKRLSRGPRRERNLAVRSGVRFQMQVRSRQRFWGQCGLSCARSERKRNLCRRPGRIAIFQVDFCAKAMLSAENLPRIGVG